MSATSKPNVVLPNFFDALVHPEVVLPLIISHLLSDELWEQRSKVVQRMPELGVPHSSIPRELYAVKRFIDKNFEHLHADKVQQIYGTISVAAEMDRLGSEGVRHGISGLRRYIEYLQKTGIDRMNWMLDAIEQGHFPNYTYSTYDVIRAHRTFSQSRKSSSNGVVSCLDEMSLFCAATLTLPKKFIYQTIILAGPSHYTVLVWDNDRNGYWFPAKRNLFSRQSWKEYVDEHFAGDVERAFDSILCETDRIISIRGSFVFATGESNIPEGLLRETAQEIERLFGYMPPDLQRALQRPITEKPPLPYHEVFLDLLGSSSHKEVLSKIRTAANDRSEEWAEEVLLAYRSTDVLHTERFIEAAMQSPLAREVSRGLHSAEDARAYVDAIPGHNSIFHEPDRIAMPDETIRLQTGSAQDRKLLYYVLTQFINER